ncbi:hypothetical protein WJ542_20230 [Paraburkholderia sp. B3]|uniref:hypothetical protein n=1 Tax=Paraburkholderia sp. B3 TaxID=3134791 RepID=UPI0039820AB7
MRVLVWGKSTYRNAVMVFHALDAFRARRGISTVVHRGSGRIGQDAEAWANVAEVDSEAWLAGPGTGGRRQRDLSVIETGRLDAVLVFGETGQKTPLLKHAHRQEISLVKVEGERPAMMKLVPFVPVEAPSATGTSGGARKLRADRARKTARWPGRAKTQSLAG